MQRSDIIAYKNKIRIELLDILGSRHEVIKKIAPDFLTKLESDTNLSPIDKFHLLLTANQAGTTLGMYFVLMMEDKDFQRYLDLLSFLQKANENNFVTARNIYHLLSLVKCYNESMSQLITSTQPMEGLKKYLQLLRHLTQQGITAKEILQLFQIRRKLDNRNSFMFITVNHVESDRIQLYFNFLIELHQQGAEIADIFTLFEDITLNGNNFLKLLANSGLHDAIAMTFKFFGLLIEKGLDKNRVLTMLLKTHGSFLKKLSESANTDIIKIYSDFIITLNDNNADAVKHFFEPSNKKPIELSSDYVNFYIEKNNYSSIYLALLNNSINKKDYPVISNKSENLLDHLLTLENSEKGKALQFALDTNHPLGQIFKNQHGLLSKIHLMVPVNLKPIYIDRNNPSLSDNKNHWLFKPPAAPQTTNPNTAMKFEILLKSGSPH